MENELGRVVDALPGLVWTALPDGHVDFLNLRWCDYTGVSPYAACGHRWQAAIHPEDLPGLREVWGSILTSGEPREKVAEKLFEALYTTKSGGMGIGLSVSRSIIENHKDRLWAVPNEGPGATFAFSIPRGTGAMTHVSGNS